MVSAEETPADRVAQFLKHRGIPKELAVLAISTLPIFELRGGIPVAIHLFRMEWWSGFFFSYLGNLLPVFPLLLFLGTLKKGLSRVPLFKNFFNWLFERTKRRGRIVERYKSLGLMVFVAIPLPITGAWTGAVAATLFGLKRLHAFIAIAVGVFIAGGIVTGLSLMGIWGGVIAGAILLGLALAGMMRFFLQKPESSC
ncbi:small multi-drug export protein [candidate division TA06 bacterium]|nr:small multi-drug export protein [candidate division TA06 bacterium]